jgi:hypothetical protein
LIIRTQVTIILVHARGGVRKWIGQTNTPEAVEKIWLLLNASEIFLDYIKELLGFFREESTILSLLSRLTPHVFLYNESLPTFFGHVLELDFILSLYILVKDSPFHKGDSVLFV